MTDRRRSLRRREDRDAEAAALRRTRVLWRNVAIGYLILLLSLAFGLWALERRDIQRTEKAQMGSCVRLNTVRSGLNDISLVAAEAFKRGAEREHRLAISGADAHGIHQKSYENLVASMRRFRYRPLTNCVEAVDHPDTYRPPAPRDFTAKELDG